MRRHLRLLAIALLIATAAATACSKQKSISKPEKPSIVWASSLEEAKAQAQKTGGRILASFEAYWCPWSRLLRESLYVNTAVIDSLSSFKCVSIDVDRDTSVCSEYDIRLYPTVIIMDPYGGEIERVVGYNSPDEFLKRLSSIKTRDALVSEMFKREEHSADDPQFLMDFADLLRDVGTYDAALMRYEKAAGLDKGNKLGIFEEATYAMAECSLLAGEYREAGDRFRYFIGACPESEKCGEAAMLAALCYERAQDPRAAIEMLETYLRDFRGDFAQFATKKLESLRTESAHTD